MQPLAQLNRTLVKGFAVFRKSPFVYVIEAVESEGSGGVLWSHRDTVVTAPGRVPPRSSGQAGRRRGMMLVAVARASAMRADSGRVALAVVYRSNHHQSTPREAPSVLNPPHSYVGTHSSA